MVGIIQMRWRSVHLTFASMWTHCKAHIILFLHFFSAHCLFAIAPSLFECDRNRLGTHLIGAALHSSTPGRQENGATIVIRMLAKRTVESTSDIAVQGVVVERRIPLHSRATPTSLSNGLLPSPDWRARS